MGVYIKDMEMPKNCHECRLYEGDIYYCSAADKMIDISDSSAEKCQFCPLIPVPHHGRLIDADELLALVYANIALFDSTPGRLGADQKLVRAWLASMAEDINDAPTIIEEER